MGDVEKSTFCPNFTSSSCLLQIYWAGPFLGAALAAFIYEFIFAVNATPRKVAGFVMPGYDNDDFDKEGRKPSV